MLEKAIEDQASLKERLAREEKLCVQLASENESIAEYIVLYQQQRKVCGAGSGAGTRGSISAIRFVTQRHFLIFSLPQALQRKTQEKDAFVAQLQYTIGVLQDKMRATSTVTENTMPEAAATAATAYVTAAAPTAAAQQPGLAQAQQAVEQVVQNAPGSATTTAIQTGNGRSAGVPAWVQLSHGESTSILAL